MPKENTHIWFANELLSSPELSEAAAEIIRPQIKDYYLGAVAPDILFYSRDSKLEQTADALHGLSGMPTNTVVMEILKRKPTPRDVAFAAGYVTHCCLDATFHPMVYYFSGNYYDDDEAAAAKAKFLHRYIETRLDIFLNSNLKITTQIHKHSLDGLLFSAIIEEISGSPAAGVVKALERQLMMNKFFYGKRSKLLPPFTINSKMNHGLFYRNVKHKDRLSTLDELLIGRNPVTGEPFETTYSKLFDAAGKQAAIRIRALLKFIKGETTLQELSQTVRGEDLDTGLLGVTAREAKFFAHNPCVRS